MSEHVITIDTPIESHTATDDFAARAYCTDECGWVGAWFHADEFPPGNWEWELTVDQIEHLPDLAARAAYLAAEGEGEAHLAEVDSLH